MVGPLSPVIRLCQQKLAPRTCLNEKLLLINNQLKSFSEVPFFGESIVRENCEN